MIEILSANRLLRELDIEQRDRFFLGGCALGLGSAVRMRDEGIDSYLSSCKTSSLKSELGAVAEVISKMTDDLVNGIPFLFDYAFMEHGDRVLAHEKFDRRIFGLVVSLYNSSGENGLVRAGEAFERSRNATRLTRYGGVVNDVLLAKMGNRYGGEAKILENYYGALIGNLRRAERGTRKF